MEYQAWCQTNVGLKRDNNQDSFLINKELGLFVVADGMGGHQGGEVASKMAVTTFEDVVRKSSPADRPRDVVMNAYLEASNRIYDKASEELDELHGMGTTMVSLWVKKDALYIANVGDSRAYLFTKGFLWQVTEDHSLLYEQFRAGLITEQERNAKTKKNVITRSVGYLRDVECDVFERKIEKGETYLLCSDGLTNMVDDRKLNQMLIETSPNALVDRLINEANANGGDDNVTVMVVSF